MFKIIEEYIVRVFFGITIPCNINLTCNKFVEIGSKEIPIIRILCFFPHIVCFGSKPHKVALYLGRYIHQLRPVATKNLYLCAMRLVKYGAILVKAVEQSSHLRVNK